MSPSTATVNVHLADSPQISALLEAIGTLVAALREEVGEPFTMTPQTQDRLKAALAEYEEAVRVLRP